VADEVAHERVDYIFIKSVHTCTDYYYSNFYLIALDLRTRYAPEIEGRMAMIRGVKFVGIPVRDQDVALKFYTEALGFKVTTDQAFTPTQRWIELMIPGADTGLALFTPEGHEDRIGSFHSISFWSDDVFATAKAMTAKGVVFFQEPKTEFWGTSAIFEDPDGNKFVLSSKGKAK
jgi:catechol 2,3-dioxygenase-like lactoylglutathione lyase family enzyme